MMGPGRMRGGARTAAATTPETAAERTRETRGDRAAGAGAAAAPAPPVLARLDGATVLREGRALLDGVSLTVAAGEVVSIIGPNGGGKSTLVKVLTGEIRPSAGSVTRALGLRIGYMPQSLMLDRSFPITVERFLSLAGGDRLARLAALERVGAAHVARAQLSALSGGERQRALLARALLREPDLLILDEPTQGLDHQGAAAFYELIDRLRREERVGVAMVSHELHVVMAAADRVLCLNRHICCQGAPAAVQADPAFQALFGLGARGLALYRHDHDHDHDH